MTRSRRPQAKKLSLRRRYLRSTVLGRLKAQKLKCQLDILIVHTLRKWRGIHRRRGYLDDARSRRLRRRDLTICFIAWHEFHLATTVATVALTEPLPVIVRKNVTINDLSHVDIPNNVRFITQAQLRRLSRGFEFPASFTSPQRYKFSGEEVLLAGLVRLTHPIRFSDATYRTLFGFDDKQASAAVLLFFEHMENWTWLVTDNTEFWKPYMLQYALAVWRMMLEKGCQHLPMPGTPDGYDIFAWIDCVKQLTCRPGGGPMLPGRNSPRFHPNIQRAFFNGWKKQHGLKWQTISLPCGMDFNVYGPESIRRNDLFLLEQSNMRPRLAEMQEAEPNEFSIYGDSAYSVVDDPHIKSKHTGDHLTPHHILENRANNSCRESGEHHYADIGNLWPTLKDKDLFKINSNTPVDSYFKVGFLLKNAYASIVGLETADTYNCHPPEFEHWLEESVRLRRAAV